MASCLRPRIPAFTLALAPGVGLAESPATGESFGEHRCGLLADGIVGADERGVPPGEARVEAVIESLADKRREDRRALPRALAGRATCPLTVCSSTRLRRSLGASWPMPSGTTVAAAGWVQPRGRSGSTAAEYHALGPSLYGGTAGVGLFLAQLANATGDGSFRRTAVGALRHATASGEAVAREQARRIPRGLSRSRLGGRTCGACCWRRESCMLGQSHFRPNRTFRRALDRCPDLITRHGRLSAGTPGTR